jgi:hypothetical protein
MAPRLTLESPRGWVDLVPQCAPQSALQALQRRGGDFNERFQADSLYFSHKMHHKNHYFNERFQTDFLYFSSTKITVMSRELSPRRSGEPQGNPPPPFPLL